MLRREFVFGAATFSLLVSGGRSFAKGIAAIKEMKIGEFIWRPELSPKGPVVVVVSIPHQLVHVYRNGLAIAVSTCLYFIKPSPPKRAMMRTNIRTIRFAMHSPGMYGNLSCLRGTRSQNRPKPRPFQYGFPMRQKGFRVVARNPQRAGTTAAADDRAGAIGED